MILGLDIGNTSTTGAVYREGAAPDVLFRFPTDPGGGVGALGDTIAARAGEAAPGEPVEGIAFASVVPAMVGICRTAARQRFGLEALSVDHTCRLGITLNYDDPSELGPDRIVNAEAAYREYGGGLIVVDAGTAVTFCVILEGGVFDGGIIAPGPGTGAWALSARAARLPEAAFEPPPRMAARNTRDAVQSGIYHGWHCLIDGLIARIEEEYGRELTTVLTGGYAGRLDLRRKVVRDGELTMKGIRYVYDLNRGA